MTIGQNLPKPGYTAPKLVVYGGMVALTAAGSAAGKEGPGVGNGVRKP